MMIPLVMKCDILCCFMTSIVISYSKLEHYLGLLYTSKGYIIHVHTPHCTHGVHQQVCRHIVALLLDLT